MTSIIQLLLIGTAAAAPTQYVHQGRLMGADGMPIEDTLGITFRLADASTDGEVLWEESLTVVLDNGGF